MKNTIGIRIEDKYLMEKRVAIIPSHVEQLKKSLSIDFEVERSDKRIFTDQEYEQAGAQLVDKIKGANIIFGVKEMPLDFFETNKTYLFFSHTIKGQDYNMPILRRMMEKKVNLIEYEKIVDQEGKRLIFFGHYAGVAGMINSFWAYGQRCKILGINNPFSELKQTHLYQSLEEATDALRHVADQISNKGIPKEIAPLTIGITGYGNVSLGVQEIIDLFDYQYITPSELMDLKRKDQYSNHIIYKTVFKESDLFKNKDANKAFDVKEYFEHPESFVNNFEQYIPNISILMNCIYWNPRCPRIVTKDYLNELTQNRHNQLKVIGDITCDPDGSIEATHIGTYIEDPVFIYNPKTRNSEMGFQGEGLLIMAVDILPSELPRESSEKFSQALLPFIQNLVETDFDLPYDKLNLTPELKRAMILHQGHLTPDYQYLKSFIS